MILYRLSIHTERGQSCPDSTETDHCNVNIYIKSEVSPSHLVVTQNLQDEDTTFDLLICPRTFSIISAKKLETSLSKVSGDSSYLDNTGT